MSVQLYTLVSLIRLDVSEVYNNIFYKNKLEQCLFNHLISVSERIAKHEHKLFIDSASEIKSSRHRNSRLSDLEHSQLRSGMTFTEVGTSVMIASIFVH